MDFYTQYDFMTFTKGLIYFLMIGILASYVGYWLFLSAKDDDDSADSHGGHGHH